MSRYHLLLDGVATSALLWSLADRRPHERLLLVTASASASLFAAGLVPGETAAHGLCGLSGVGHGLMAGVAVLAWREGDAVGRRTARVLLSVVVLKSAVEAATGHTLVDLVQLGDLGRPNRLCHLGGVIGGALVAAVLRPAKGTRPGGVTSRGLDVHREAGRPERAPRVEVLQPVRDLAATGSVP